MELFTIDDSMFTNIRFRILKSHDFCIPIQSPESQVLYGLHPNAEIGFFTLTSETLFRTVSELQPHEG